MPNRRGKVVATIEARMNSSRLPGKVLKPAVGKPMLELLIERLGRAKTVSEIVVATTVNPADAAIADLARRVGVGCFRGSEEDVLGRVVGAARSANADVLVEITGDCPLLEPTVVDRLVEIYRAGDHDYVANILKPRQWPIGMDVQVFAADLLAEVEAATQDPADREHVSFYIYSHPEKYKLFNLEIDLPQRHHLRRLTLDTPGDYALIRAIFEELYPEMPAFTLDDILALLDRRPDLAELNGPKP